MATSSSPETVGVIDVGSNTIKLLIAKPGSKVPAEKVEFIVEETRIGEGMTGQPPTIDADAIARGSAAIARLAQAASNCNAICIVATSAVRDSSNKQAFVNAVEKACGHELRILSGDEEAAYIGLALKCDPALSQLDSYSLLDLGGGSLECIQFSNHKLLNAESLQLGSVRLASLLLTDRTEPLTPANRARIARYVQEHWSVSQFPKNSSPSEIAVLTGGAAKHLSESLTGSQLINGLSISEFTRIAHHLCSLPLIERVQQYGIPESRADIFPTAMITLEESLKHLGCERLYFSEYNLRFGVATTLLTHGRLVAI
ncbi:Ppx/GppA phosphatase family [Verrucomicrobiia bacterium DG1235]|nr:Ppx/GppA phosphatase family [Verrucomicrobiae bacterium DG1235]